MSDIEGSLADFLSPASFWDPDTIVPSAWHEHTPFAFWVTQALRPSRLVELGTHFGHSYLAFCQAIKRLDLPTTAFAVDTWVGDTHSGEYGPEVLARLRGLNEARYSSFSQLLQMDFAEAAELFEDHSIDLLHIDGRHFFEDVWTDFNTYFPKLSDRAVVLFHDTQVLERDFGVHRVWAKVSSEFPSFEFTHGHGLGVLAVGTDIAEPIRKLTSVANDSELTVLIRNAYAHLGAAIETAAQCRSFSEQIVSEQAAAAAALADRDEALNQAAAENLRLAERVAQLETDREAAERSKHRLETELAVRLRKEKAAAAQIQAMRQSASWRLSKPVRAAGGTARRIRRRAARANSGAIDSPKSSPDDRALVDSSGLFNSKWYCNQHPDATGSDPLAHFLSTGTRVLADPSPDFDSVWYAQRHQVPDGISPLVHYLRSAPADQRWPSRWFDPELYARTHPEFDAATEHALVHFARSRKVTADISLPELRQNRCIRVALISTAPSWPGHRYRVADIADSLPSAYFNVVVTSVDERKSCRRAIKHADVIWLWRTELSPELERDLLNAKRRGAKIIFDSDDLVFRPELARPDQIPGSVTDDDSAEEAARSFRAIKAAMHLADHCTASTQALAVHMRLLGKPTSVVPNGYNRHSWKESSDAATEPSDDGLLRIGYAGGTPTHQEDFRVCAGVVGRVLRERPTARLVLFDGCVDAAAFPELDEVRDQIEWRSLVPIAQLPKEYARFSVNIAPLQANNLFCDSKSELKYFEAAMVSVPTIASPTQPFVAAITDGRNGMIARDEDEWYEKLSALLESPAERAAMARSARDAALWPYSPERRVQVVGRIVGGLVGGGLMESQLFSADISTSFDAATDVPDVPPFDVVFEAVSGPTPDTTVVIPLHNYEQYIEEALCSVRAQTVDSLDLIVIDDQSTDGGPELVSAWMQANAPRFGRVTLLRNRENSKLARTRNTGFDHARTPWVLPLDADNVLLPECVNIAQRVLELTGAAVAYPRTERFGEADGHISDRDWSPALLRGGNYIDAMALISKACWRRVGGFSHIEHGWEDYEFWLKLAEAGLHGTRIPITTARYRVHGQSMLSTQTEPNLQAVIGDVLDRHPWLWVDTAHATLAELRQAKRQRASRAESA